MKIAQILHKCIFPETLIWQH